MTERTPDPPRRHRPRRPRPRRHPRRRHRAQRLRLADHPGLRRDRALAHPGPDRPRHRPRTRSAPARPSRRSPARARRSFRIAEFPPDAAYPQDAQDGDLRRDRRQGRGGRRRQALRADRHFWFHRTDSLDYAVVLEGEITLARRRRRGDPARPATSRSSARRATPGPTAPTAFARVAFVLIGTEPISADEIARQRRESVRTSGVAVIIDPDAAEGEVIWSLDSDRPSRRRNVARFADFLRGRGVRPRGRLRRTCGSGRSTNPSGSGRVGRTSPACSWAASAGPVRTAEPMPQTRWFPGRTLNYARHLLDGHDGVALIAIAEDGSRTEITFAELRAQVGAFAAHLRSVGVGPGDRVVAILPNVTEAVVGAARHGIGRRGLVGVRAGVRTRRDHLALPTARAEGRHRGSRVPARRQGPRPRHRAGGGASHRFRRVQSVVWVTGHTDAAPIPVGRAGGRLGGGDRRPRARSSSPTSSSAIRSGCSSPRGRPGCRRASCTATAALCSSS